MDKPIRFSSEQPSTVLRSLGSLEEAFWLVDQSSPLHFTLTGEVKGETTVAVGGPHSTRSNGGILCCRSAS